MATKKVLACSHSRSLQLLYTVGGSQARLDARTEFEIFAALAKGGGKLVVQQAVRANAFYLISRTTFTLVTTPGTKISLLYDWPASVMRMTRSLALY